MKRSLNPHEVRLVAEILDDSQYDQDPDPARMAQAIVRAINERRERERMFVVGVQGATGVITMHGPYLTRNAALKGRSEALIGHASGVVGVWPVLSASDPQDLDEPGPFCIERFEVWH